MNQCTLIVCEKPSVAEAIADVIGQCKKSKGYYECQGYLITWVYGHLIDLYDAEDYNRRYKRWSMDTLPILPQRFMLKVKADVRAKDQYDLIKSLVNREDVVSMINACDAGREGELIFRYLYHMLDTDKPVKRLWLSSVVPSAIRKAMGEIKEGHEYDRLAAAAVSRSQGDWLVGINATRAYTVHFKALLNLGRVQTPTLAMIVRREQEIQNFRSQCFYELIGEFDCQGHLYEGKWQGADSSRIQDIQTATQLCNKLTGATGLISKVSEKESKQFPPLLYNLTELQKDANRMFGFTAQKTLNCAQTLYDEKKRITYPRTDSQYITSEVFKDLPSVFQMISHTAYGPLIQNASLQDSAVFARIVNAKKVGDHHAIIPTAYSYHSPLQPDLQKIYDLIIRRFIAVFYPPALYFEQEIITIVEHEQFLSKGKTLRSPGWKVVYRDQKKAITDPDADQLARLPSLTQGSLSKVVTVTIKEGETTPPARFTEGSLLTAMETAGKQATDESIREVMKEKGIGTVASRPQIIEKLKKTEYIISKKRLIYPTDKGMQLIASIPDGGLTSPEMTGEWEKRLRDMERGQESQTGFMDDIRLLTKEIVAQVVSIPKSSIDSTRTSLGLCPVCQSVVREDAKGFRCTNRNCHFVIWKRIAGKALSPTQAKKLLTTGSTDFLKGFKSKVGKSFSARIILDQGKTIFAFDDHKKHPPKTKKKP